MPLLTSLYSIAKIPTFTHPPSAPPTSTSTSSSTTPGSNNERGKDSNFTSLLYANHRVQKRNDADTNANSSGYKRSTKSPLSSSSTSSTSTSPQSSYVTRPNPMYPPSISSPQSVFKTPTYSSTNSTSNTTDGSGFIIKKSPTSVTDEAILSPPSQSSSQSSSRYSASGSVSSIRSYTQINVKPPPSPMLMNGGDTPSVNFGVGMLNKIRSGVEGGAVRGKIEMIANGNDDVDRAFGIGCMGTQPCSPTSGNKTKKQGSLKMKGGAVTLTLPKSDSTNTGRLHSVTTNLHMPMPTNTHASMSMVIPRYKHFRPKPMRTDWHFVNNVRKPAPLKVVDVADATERMDMDIMDTVNLMTTGDADGNGRSVVDLNDLLPPSNFENGGDSNNLPPTTKSPNLSASKNHTNSTPPPTPTTPASSSTKSSSSSSTPYTKNPITPKQNQDNIKYLLQNLHVLTFNPKTVFYIQYSRVVESCNGSDSGAGEIEYADVIGINSLFDIFEKGHDCSHEFTNKSNGGRGDDEATMNKLQFEVFRQYEVQRLLAIHYRSHSLLYYNTVKTWPEHPTHLYEISNFEKLEGELNQNESVEMQSMLVRLKEDEERYLESQQPKQSNYNYNYNSSSSESEEKKTWKSWMLKNLTIINSHLVTSKVAWDTFWQRTALINGVSVTFWERYNLSLKRCGERLNDEGDVVGVMFSGMVEGGGGRGSGSGPKIESREYLSKVAHALCNEREKLFGMNFDNYGRFEFKSDLSMISSYLNSTNPQQQPQPQTKPIPMCIIQSQILKQYTSIKLKSQKERVYTALISRLKQVHPTDIVRMDIVKRAVQVCLRTFDDIRTYFEKRWCERMVVLDGFCRGLKGCEKILKSEWLGDDALSQIVLELHAMCVEVGDVDDLSQIWRRVDDSADNSIEDIVRAFLFEAPLGREELDNVKCNAFSLIKSTLSLPRQTSTSTARPRQTSTNSKPSKSKASSTDTNTNASKKTKLPSSPKRFPTSLTILTHQESETIAEPHTRALVPSPDNKYEYENVGLGFEGPALKSPLSVFSYNLQVTREVSPLRCRGRSRSRGGNAVAEEKKEEREVEAQAQEERPMAKMPKLERAKSSPQESTRSTDMVLGAPMFFGSGGNSNSNDDDDGSEVMTSEEEEEWEERCTSEGGGKRKRDRSLSCSKLD